MGRVVTEAMACGKPVLISNKVQIWRDIAEDGAGRVENDDVAGTDQLIRRWLALTDEEKAVMGIRAQKCFENRFEIDKAAESLLAILRKHGARG